MLIYRGPRKTKLSLEDEYLHDFQSNYQMETLKRRFIETTLKVREDIEMRVVEESHRNEEPVLQEND